MAALGRDAALRARARLRCCVSSPSCASRASRRMQSTSGSSMWASRGRWAPPTNRSRRSSTTTSVRRASRTWSGRSWPSRPRWCATRAPRTRRSTDLSDALSPREVVELLMVIGQYMMVARVMATTAHGAGRAGRPGCAGASMTTVREASYELLRAHGLTTVFGNPGSTELPFLSGFPDGLPLRARPAGGDRGRHGGRLRAGERAARARQPAHRSRRGQRDGRALQRAREQVAAGRHGRTAGAGDDDDRGPAHEPRRDHAAAAGDKVELRAAAAAGRSLGAGPRDAPCGACRPAGRCSCRSRWTTGRPRPTSRSRAP